MTNNNYTQILNAFEKIEQNIGLKLIQNRDIFKLLHFEDWDINPYDMDIDDSLIENMLTQFDENHKTNQNCRVFFDPFVAAPELLQRSQIRIFPMEVDPVDIYEATIDIQIDIIVNLAVNKFRGGRRMNALAAEVLKALNGQEIGLTRPLELIDNPLRLFQFKDDFWGYIIFLRTGIAANGF